MSLDFDAEFTEADITKEIPREVLELDSGQLVIANDVLVDDAHIKPLNISKPRSGVDPSILSQSIQDAFFGESVILHATIMLIL